MRSNLATEDAMADPCECCVVQHSVPASETLPGEVVLQKVSHQLSAAGV